MSPRYIWQKLGKLYKTKKRNLNYSVNRHHFLGMRTASLKNSHKMSTLHFFLFSLFNLSIISFASSSWRSRDSSNLSRSLDKGILFSCPEQLNRWPCPLLGPLVCLRPRDKVTYWAVLDRTTLRSSNPIDVWPLRPLIRWVMRRHLKELS